jgi:hypothetical protein
MSAEMAGGFEVAQQAKPKLFACANGVMSAEIAAGNFSQ